MRTFKFKIKNFMIIENAELEFRPGLTTIVGPSNNGKTTILVALQAMLYNQSVDAMIKHGTDTTSLGIQYQGNTIMWRRSLKSGSKIVYKINKEVLTKVGRTQPEELLELLPFEDKPIASSRVRLNFINQGDAPLLVSSTGSVLYDFLSKSNQTEELNKVTKDMKDDIKELSNKKTQLEGTVEYLRSTLKEERETYERVRSCDFTVMRVLELDSKNNKIKDLDKTIETVLKSNKEVKKIKQESKGTLDKLNLIETYLDEVQPIHNKLKDLKERVTNLSNIDNEKQRLSTELKSIESRLDNLRIDELGENLSQIKSITNELARLQDTMDKIYTITEKREVLQKQIDAVNVELSEVTKQLGEFNVCPLCHSQLKGDKHEH